MISSVYTDGAIDVSRNPAIISTHERSAAGLYLTYGAFRNEKIEDFNISTTDTEKYNLKSMNEYRGRVIGSLLFKQNRSAWGLCITSGDNDQVSYTDKTEEITLATLLEKKKIISRKINPALIFSYSSLIGDHYSFGIRLKESFLYTVEKTQSESLSAAIKISETETTVKHTLTCTELSAGLLRKFGATETGLIISSGALSLEKKSINFTEKDLITPAEWNGEKETGFIRRIKGGFGIEAGGYTRLTPFFAIALEIGYAIPFASGTNNFEKDKTAKTYRNNTSYSSTDGLYGFKGGMEWTLSPGFALSTGGAFYSVSTDETEITNSKKLNMNIYVATLQIDYYINKNYRLTIGSFFKYSDSDVYFKTDAFSFTMSSELAQIDIMAGVNIIF